MTNNSIAIERINKKPVLDKNQIALGFDKNDFKNKKSSLCNYGFDLAIIELMNLYDIKNSGDAINLFYDRYIDKISNDYFFKEQSTLLSFNLYWYENVNNITNCDIQFFKAVEFMIIIIENWLRQIKEDVDFRTIEDEIWNKAEETQEDGIYILDRHIPWQYQVKKNPNTKAKIIIFKSNRGNYSVVSKFTKEIQIKNSEYLSFVHPFGFMGTADNLENAILVAKQSINRLVLCAINIIYKIKFELIKEEIYECCSCDKRKWKDLYGM